MSHEFVEHATTVVERRFAVSPARVFAAFADPAQVRQWHAPSQDWIIHEQRQDFRVGGEEFFSFGPKNGPLYRSQGFYIDIVDNQRIVSSGAMYDEDGRFSSTMATVEVMPDGDGARLRVTDQSAFFRGETAADRAGGWDELMKKLEACL